MRQKAETEDLQIIARLGSRDAAEQKQAEQQLEERGLNSIDRLIAILNAEHRRRRKLRRLFKIGRYAAFLMLSFLYDLRVGHFPSFGLTLGLLLLTGFISTVIWSETRRRFRRGMVIALSRFEDVTLVGPLIDLHRGESREAVTEMLTRLLPRLTASDAALLKESHRNHLYMELDLCCGSLVLNIVSERFILAILKALEQVGDKRGLGFVEKVAKQGQTERIRNAAQACLPFLQERVEDQQMRTNLLRASHAATAPTELLRPADKSTDTEPQQLLRANVSERPEDISRNS